ncbi:hypothetical protein BDFB_014564, partial [Asbolus verrucosus]
MTENPSHPSMALPDSSTRTKKKQKLSPTAWSCNAEPNEANADLDHVDEIEQFARYVRHQHIEEPIPPCSPAEIPELIKSLHTRKALGPDSISNRAMKNLPDKALVAFTAIVSA